MPKPIQAPLIGVHTMLKGLGNAIADHSLNLDFSPASPDQTAFNAALAVIDGVRPKDEIEAMLAAHMAVANIVFLELVARTRGAVAGHRYEGNGIKRLDVLGNLTTKFMRTYTMQVGRARPLFTKFSKRVVDSVGES